MAVAADVLASVAPGEQPPESVREEGIPPRAVRIPFRPVLVPPPGSALPSSLATAAAAVVDAELAEMEDGGRLAVIAPTSRIGELTRTLPAAVPGDRPEVLDSPVALLTVGQSKGLEFDRVVLVDAAGLLAQSPAGGHDLYVAITRATHRLTVVHDGDLPASLRRLVTQP
jgi:UvrD-like helicase C-terminal domain